MRYGHEQTSDFGTERDSSANMLAFADHSRTTWGFVYFIRAGRTSNVKIGWTVNDPDKRLREMQTGCPHQLHLIGYFPATEFIEHDWHDRWRHLNNRGEWFALSNNLRTAINQRLMQPDATCFILIRTDWRAVRRGELS